MCFEKKNVNDGILPFYKKRCSHIENGANLLWNVTETKKWNKFEFGWSMDHRALLDVLEKTEEKIIFMINFCDGRGNDKIGEKAHHSSSPVYKRYIV